VYLLIGNLLWVGASLKPYAICKYLFLEQDTKSIIVPFFFIYYVEVNM
jgi:hypothetical protein